MSRTIDQRVVEMQFDNRQFESGVQTSISTLDKLKQSLNLSGASKGLETVNNAARNNNLSMLGSAAEAVGLKFSAMYTVADQTMRNITNSIEHTATRMIKALTIDPVKTGFSEYETQMNAVQTILSNTRSKGSTLTDVNNALNELNTYADKTIYNFTEMTRNIGTFTAAGIGLETATQSIKGIANLAAVSGSSSQQASTAMYQLSQALAAGKVQLQDWNSVVNAGMGGQVFQDALKRTATNMGTNVDAMIKKYGSFRESLTKGQWLTSDVLTETLKQLSGAYTEADLLAKGYTKEQAKEILALAKDAEHAATKVKTFTQLWDTLKEAAQSGWTQTWQIIIGDFEEARDTLTKVSDVVGEIIGKSAASRNALLQDWKDLGGRQDLVDSFSNIFKALVEVSKPVSEAFREIFPPATGKQLKDITGAIKSFTEKLTINEETSDKLKRTFKGVFSIFDIFRKVLSAVVGSVTKFSGGISSVGELFLDVTASIGDFFTSVNESMNLEGFKGGLSKFVEGISGAIEKAVGSLDGLGAVIAKIAGGVWNAIKEAFTWIADNISVGDIFAGLAGGGVFMVAKKLGGLFDKITDIFDGFLGKGGEKAEGLKEKFANVLDTVSDSLQSFTSSIRIGSVVAVAIAVGILSSSLRKISELSAMDISKSLLGIAGLFMIMNISFNSIINSLDVFEGKGLIKAGVTMILMAKSIDILADAMHNIASLNVKELAKGLVGVGIGLAELCFGLKIIDNVKIKSTTAVGIIALAKGCEILGDALNKFAELSWEEIKRGLVGMGGALGEFVIALAVLGKFGGFKSLLGSIGVLIAVQSLADLFEGFKKFSDMEWDEIKRGLVGMSGALAEVAGISGVLGKLTGFKGILGSSALLIAVQGLSKLADGLKAFGEMTWDEIKRGLAGMGWALMYVLGFTGTIGKLAGFSGILGSGSLLIAVQSLGKLADSFKQFGEMTWDEIKRGLAGMGGALTEVGVITGAMGYLTGFAGLLGSGSIWVAVQGLGDLAEAFKKFGDMSWDEIKKGLAAMGGALAELAFGGMLNTFSIIGSASIATVSDDIGILADSVRKWTGVTVPEGLGLKIASLATGIMAFTFGGAGASAIALAAPAIGTLADSVQRWTGLTIPDGLNDRIGSLAGGVKAFTFSTAGAVALSMAAPAVGTLADSVKRWSGVSIPEGLNGQLSSLSEGVKSFTWAFMGGWSLSALDTPLGNLADSVKKWADVTVPNGLEDQLKSLSEGVKSFTWAFMGGWSLSALVNPLSNLVDSIKKWNGVAIPDGLKDQLKSLSDGVRSFTWAFVGGWSIEEVAGPLGTLATSVKKWNGVTVPEGLGSDLKTLAGGVKAFSGVGDITTETDGVKSLASAASKLSSVNFTQINSSLNGFSTSLTNFSTSAGSLTNVGNTVVNNIVNPIKNAGSKISSAGSSLMNSFSRSIQTKTSSITSAMNNIVSKVITSVGDKKDKFTQVGYKLASALGPGFTKSSNSIKTSLSKTISNVVSSINGYYTNFYNSGAYLVTGFANGISANTYKAKAKAAAMAAAAAAAARAELDEHSPSKVGYEIGDFFGVAFVDAIGSYTEKAYDTSASMAMSARDGLNSAVGKINRLLSSDMDMRPTIKPVLDLSNVSAGAGQLNNMLNMGPAIGVSANVGAINTMMAARNQNGVNDDVVSAINRLRGELGNVGGTSYSINGITYDDGSNVANAVKSLVTAAITERRK